MQTIAVSGIGIGSNVVIPQSHVDPNKRIKIINFMLFGSTINVMFQTTNNGVPSSFTTQIPLPLSSPIPPKSDGEQTALLQCNQGDGLNLYADATSGVTGFINYVIE